MRMDPIPTEMWKGAIVNKYSGHVMFANGMACRIADLQFEDRLLLEQLMKNGLRGNGRTRSAH
jgi:hypothetical protein